MTLQDELIQESLNATRDLEKRSHLLLVIFSLLLLCGMAAFVFTIFGLHAARAWRAYLINFVFWTGLACGAILFVAIMNMTHAKWSRPIKRFAEALGAFLPASCVLFIILYFGRWQIFPWMHKPVEGKQLWLNAEFMFIRNGAGLFLFAAFSLALLYLSGSSDRELLLNPSSAGSQAVRKLKLQAILSPIIGILYAVVLSLLAIDLIMSLDPHWVSTLFGAYYFIGSFYTALAALILLCGLSLSLTGLEKFIMQRQFHDLGKLLLGFCLVTGDFFYSQFLVIWYGNLPEETRYVVLRVRQGTWEPLAWTILILCFALPFMVLLVRKIKMKPALMIVLSCIILVGMWLERLLLIAPSLWKETHIPLGMTELFISGGFLGITGLCVLVFLRLFPILPLSDPLFLESLTPSHPSIKEHML